MSSGLGLREWAERSDGVTFLNRTECCQRFDIKDNNDNIKIIEKVISEVPAHSVVIFDEVPLSSKRTSKELSYNWSTLKNRRPEEVTAVVCLQPIRLDVAFKAKTHNVRGPKDADMIELSHQYRSTQNIQNFVNQLCKQGLPVEYANVQAFPGHDTQGPEITAVSFPNNPEDLKVWLGNQLQKELACHPSQVKMIYTDSSKDLTESVTQGTVYETSMTSIEDFRGCETPVAVTILGKLDNYSQLLEMCSRAQYKLILVIQDNQPLCEEMVGHSVKDICDVASKPVLLTGTNTDSFAVGGVTPLQITTHIGGTGGSGRDEFPVTSLYELDSRVFQVHAINIIRSELTDCKGDSY